MATLHGEAANPGDKVYDEDLGWGTIESVTCSCLWVNIGKRTKRKYTKDGFAPRACRPTLFWHPLPRIKFAKDACMARKQAEFLAHSVDLLNQMQGCSCNTTIMEDPEIGGCCNECTGQCTCSSTCGAE